MELEERKVAERIGVFLGFLFSYSLFTGMLFLILTLLEKLPPSWIWVHVALITLGITVFGMLLQEVLK